MVTPQYRMFIGMFKFLDSTNIERVTKDYKKKFKIFCNIPNCVDNIIIDNLIVNFKSVMFRSADNISVKN